MNNKIWVGILIVLISLVTANVLIADPGDYNIEGRTLLLDLDGDTTIGATTNNILVLTVAGTAELTLTQTRAIFNSNVTLQGLDLDDLVTGDILYASGANVLARLAAGSNTDILTLAAGIPSWVAIPISYTDSQAIAAVEGEATLDLTGDVTITNDNFLVVGNTAQAVNTFPLAAEFQVLGDGADDSAFGIARWVVNGGGPSLMLTKGRGANIGDLNIVFNNDLLGAIRWSGMDGITASSKGAEILVNVDGTPGDGDMPARMTFSTSSDGSDSPSFRLIIDSAGDFDFNNGNLNNLGDAGTDITSTGATFGSSIPVTINDTTSSTSKDTGALIVEGGIGVEENIVIGGDSIKVGQDVLLLAANRSVIRAIFHTAGLADNVATAVFTITTTDEAVNDAGAWHLEVVGFAGHRVIDTGNGGAIMGFKQHVDRYMAHTAGFMSGVTEDYQDTAIGNDLGLRTITSVTMTAVETSEFITTIKFKVDLAGSAITTALITIEATLTWSIFNTAPVLANS